MGEAVCPSQGRSVLPLELRGVGFSAGGRMLLRDISLSVEAGTRTVVLGPNGAGKSLLLKLCHGLIRPAAGSLRWALDDPRTLRRAQAMVLQRPVMLRRSAVANVGYALAALGVARRRRAALAQAALEQVGLGALAQRPARVLSGGEQQRLALARAWALRPQILFLDEPTANLDPAATRLIETAIEDIYRRGTTLVMTTHDLGQARRHADRVVFLHHGRMLEQSAAGRFFRRPGSAQARAFLAGELLD